jgi:hypothetical protein
VQTQKQNCRLLRQNASTVRHSETTGSRAGVTIFLKLLAVIYGSFSFNDCG